ncbi:MAG: hypothetical protein LC722_09305 [Actinobacteria bacterium]|nr:hypothetical protein [Actinomycetota bacterium]
MMLIGCDALTIRHVGWNSLSSMVSSNGASPLWSEHSSSGVVVWVSGVVGWSVVTVAVGDWPSMVGVSSPHAPPSSRISDSSRTGERRIAVSLV